VPPLLFFVPRGGARSSSPNNPPQTTMPRHQTNNNIPSPFDLFMGLMTLLMLVSATWLLAFIL